MCSLILIRCGKSLNVLASLVLLCEVALLPLCAVAQDEALLYRHGSDCSHLPQSAVAGLPVGLVLLVIEGPSFELARQLWQ